MTDRIAQLCLRVLATFRPLETEVWRQTGRAILAYVDDGASPYAKGQCRFWRLRTACDMDGNCLAANCALFYEVTQSRWVASLPPVMSGKIGSGTLQLSAELSKSRAIQKKAPAGEEQRALLTGGGRKSGQSPSGTTVFWTVTVLN